MKNITKFLAVSMASLLFTSCNRDEIAAVNVNESFPTIVEPIYLLPNIQASMALGVEYDGRYLGKYIQNFSQNTSSYAWDLYGYTPASDAGGEIWKMAYYTIGLNLPRAIEGANAAQRYDISGLSKAIQAWSWQITTDYHSELIKFDQVFTSRLIFDYGTQQDAYTEVIRLAKEGISDLQRTDGKSDETYTAKGDLIYNGKKDKWIKFAYGILARNANNLSNKSTYDPNVVIGYVDKALASIDDDCYVKFSGIANADTNFFGPSRNNLSSFRQTDFIVHAMDGTVFNAVDPRMANILSPSADGVFRGNPLNTTAGTVTATRIPNLWGTNASGSSTTAGRYIFRNTADFPIMTYSEMQFIKAEAAFIKGDKATALAAYIKGITASIDMVNRNTVVTAIAPTASLITAAQKTAFLSNANVVPTAANLTLKHIIMQKYIALFGYGYVETWTDMRKYHYDTTIYETMVFPSTLYADNSGKLAYRVRPRYNSEYVWNFSALQAIGADKADYHTKEMWFSQP